MCCRDELIHSAACARNRRCSLLAGGNITQSTEAYRANQCDDDSRADTPWADGVQHKQLDGREIGGERYAQHSEKELRPRGIICQHAAPNQHAAQSDAEICECAEQSDGDAQQLGIAAGVYNLALAGSEAGDLPPPPVHAQQIQRDGETQGREDECGEDANLHASPRAPISFAANRAAR